MNASAATFPDLVQCDQKPGTAFTRVDYYSFKAGDFDETLGVKIKEIYRRSHDFIVYIDTSDTLQWYCPSELDCDAAPIFNRAGDLEAKAQFLRRKIGPEENLVNLTSALRLIAEGVAEVCDTRDVKYANAALDTADKFITQRAREVSRRWYFLPFLIFFAFSFLVVLLSHVLDPALNRAIAIVCACGGGVGSFVSRALDSDHTPISASAGRALHWIEATMRWCIGLTAGMIVWLLVKGNIAASFINLSDAGESGRFAVIALAILAGASERLFPSLIKTFDDSIKKNGQQSRFGPNEPTQKD